MLWPPPRTWNALKAKLDRALHKLRATQRNSQQWLEMGSEIQELLRKAKAIIERDLKKKKRGETS